MSAMILNKEDAFARADKAIAEFLKEHPEMENKLPKEVLVMGYMLGYMEGVIDCSSEAKNIVNEVYGKKPK